MPYIDQQARDAMFDDDDDEFEDVDDIIDMLNAPPVTGAKSAGSTVGSKAQSVLNAGYQAGYYGTWAGGYVAQGLSGAVGVTGMTLASYSAPLAGGALAAAWPSR